jgi:hypothetical protein
MSSHPKCNCGQKPDYPSGSADHEGFNALDAQYGFPPALSANGFMRCQAQVYVIVSHWSSLT